MYNDYISGCQESSQRLGHGSMPLSIAHIILKVLLRNTAAFAVAASPHRE